MKYKLNGKQVLLSNFSISRINFTCENNINKCINLIRPRNLSRCVEKMKS